MRELSRRNLPWGEITVVSTDDICAYLSGKYDRFPSGGHIYHNGVDVTPRDEKSIELLKEMSGEFSVSISPGAPIIPMLLMTAVSIGIGYLLRPDIDLEVDASDKWDAGSPTNSPARLPNSARIGKRVPDIYGYVLHTPDLLAPLLTRYEAGQRVEYAYLSAGRGLMSNERFDVFDGDIDVSTISGYSVAVWEPDSNIFDTPQHTIGTDIDFSVLRTICWRYLDAAKYEAIPPHNNQTMLAATDGAVSQLRPLASDADGFWSQGHIYSMLGNGTYGYTYDVDYDLSIQYPPGSKIRIQNVGITSGGYDIPAIAGDYEVLQSTGGYATLLIPDALKDAWDSLSAAVAPLTSMDIVQLPAILEYTLPVVVNYIDVTLEASSGLYFADSSRLVTRSFQVYTTWTRNDGVGSPLVVVNSAEVVGNSRTVSGTTLRVNTPVLFFAHECSVEVIIVSTSAFNDSFLNWSEGSEGRVDLLSIAAALEAYEPEALETTTMLTRVPSNPATALLRKRGITVATSKQLHPDGFIDEPFNDSWSDIVADMAVDPRVGRMPFDVTAWAGWNDVKNAMRTYYNNDGEMNHFGLVVDGDSTSFEEMLGMVASALGMIVYRMGDSIQFKHIKPQTTPALLFNCRNKLPNSETRSFRFGSEDNIDQVTCGYKDREEDSYENKTVAYPDTGSEYTPLKSGVVGLQYQKQADLIANRRYYQAIYEYVFVEFTATEEAALLLPGDLILNTDSTSADLIEGELTGVVSLTLTLGNEVKLREDVADTTDFLIFVQLPDGTVESRRITNPTHTFVDTITINTALTAYSTDDTNFARTTYYIVADTTSGVDADLFIVDTVSPEDKGTYRVTAHNYDVRIFQDDPTV